MNTPDEIRERYATFVSNAEERIASLAKFVDRANERIERAYAQVDRALIMVTHGANALDRIARVVKERGDEELLREVCGILGEYQHQIAAYEHWIFAGDRGAKDGRQR